jgi:hypothetical protein
MLRPYTVVACALIDDDNAVHMIGHHDECIHGDVREMPWNLMPASCDDSPGDVELHAPGGHNSEGVFGTVDPDRDEVRARARGVKPAEPERAAVVRDPEWDSSSVHRTTLGRCPRAAVSFRCVIQHSFPSGARGLPSAAAAGPARSG